MPFREVFGVYGSWAGGRDTFETHPFGSARYFRDALAETRAAFSMALRARCFFTKDFRGPLNVGVCQRGV